jgi:hypothetical protein
LVEQRIENPRVAGSIPALGTIFSVMILCGYGEILVSCETLIFALGVVWGVARSREHLLTPDRSPRAVGYGLGRTKITAERNAELSDIKDTDSLQLAFIPSIDRARCDALLNPQSATTQTNCNMQHAS